MKTLIQNFKGAEKIGNYADLPDFVRSYIERPGVKLDASGYTEITGGTGRSCRLSLGGVWAGKSFIVDSFGLINDDLTVTFSVGGLSKFKTNPQT